MKLVARWWRENRPSAPTLFDDELIEVLERLTGKPDLGGEYERVDREVIRRVLLRRSEQHVYYAVEKNGVIVVYTVWGARRGRGPKL